MTGYTAYIPHETPRKRDTRPENELSGCLSELLLSAAPENARLRVCHRQLKITVSRLFRVMPVNGHDVR
jgi:hypothetical protein